MINIEIDHAWCHCFWEDDPVEFEALRSACSYKTEGYWFSPAYQKGRWDGKKCLFQKVRSQNRGGFPSGIFQDVILNLRKEDELEIHVEDRRIYPYYPPQIDSSNLTFDLRDYQEKAGEACLQERRGVLCLPTAAGKTKTMVAVIASLNLPTLWITHEGALANQSRDAILEGIKCCDEVGLYGAGKKDIQKWTVGLVQSLSRHRKDLDWWFKQIKVVILDECHRGAGKTWSSVLLSIPAPFRYGISATPFERSDKSVLELKGATGNVIFQQEVEEIKEYLSQPNVEMIEIPSDVSCTKVFSLNWADIYRDGIVENRLRNQIVIDRAMLSVKEESACIIFVSAINHGRIIYDMLQEEIGISSLHEFIWGKTPRNKREECYNRLREGSLRVLIATDKVAGEGQDIPSVKRIVIASGMKSAILAKQRVGRGMRPEEKSSNGWGGEVFIHDFIDLSYPRLTAHSDMRKLHYKDIGSIIKETKWQLK